MRCRVKLWFVDSQNKPFMGIGLVWLLERIVTLKSIKKAAEDMHLSYPKAIRIIKSLERGLGYPVLVRSKGGNSHGGAELTDQAKEFLRRYKQLLASVQTFTESTFKQLFE